MHIAINIKNESLSHKILEYLSSFRKEDVQIETIEQTHINEEKFSSFAGLWKDRSVDLDTIRESAWKK